MSFLFRPLFVGLLATVVGLPTLAQDALRGARQYLRLDAGVPSCLTCHGPDPAQGRNNLLRAADNPAALQKALNAVGAMGFLKGVLTRLPTWPTSRPIWAESRRWPIRKERSAPGPRRWSSAA